jgi:iron complex outermembrane receptor protein
MRTSSRFIAITVFALSMPVSGSAMDLSGDSSGRDWPAALTQERRFDIAPQPLDEGLKQFANQAGLQIMFSPDLVQGRVCPPIKGIHTGLIVLRQLLEGTGLDFAVQGTMIAVRAMSAAEDEGEIGPNALGREQSSWTSPAYLASTAARQDPRSSQADEERDSAGEGTRGEPEPSGVDDIIVVGSRLSNQEQQAVPVRILDRIEIERSGAGSVSQVLNALPEVSIQASTSPMQSSRGYSSVQLRGLPGGTTLVLLNGRRMTGTPFQASGGAVNLNLLPISAVERIEVLPAGSSALHGGDALAGVVNIVLRRDFSGFEAGGRYGSADNYDERQVSFSMGWNSKRGSLSFVGIAAGNSELQGLDRDITADSDYTRFGGHDARQAYTNPGNVYSLTGGNLPGLNAPWAAVPAQSSGVGLTPVDFAATDGVLNLNPSFWGYAAQIPETERRSGLVYGTFFLTPEIELFSEFLYAEFEAKEIDYPFFLSGRFGQFVVPPSNPFNPFGVPVGVDYLFEGAGRWCFCLEQEYYRPLLGARGRLGDWNWEVAGTLTRGEDRSSEGPLLNGALVNAALADPDPATALNPFAERTWTYEELEPYLSQEVNDMRSELRSVDGFVRGTLFDVGAGPVEALFGAQYDKSELDYHYYVQRFAADRSSYAVFSEVRVPLLASPRGTDAPARLLLSGAARYDHYSDFGSRTSPQFGIEFRPVDSLLLRAAYGEAFKPPTLYQLSSPLEAYPGVPVVDPQRGGEAYGMILRQGGNPNLEPMTGESTTFGLVFEPESLEGLELTATHWTVKIDDYTSIVSYQNMVNNESMFQDEVIRADPTPEDIANGYPGRILQVDNVTVNFGAFDLAGVDLGLTWRMQTSAGELIPSFSVTNAYKYDAALVPQAPVEDRAGKANSGGYAPEWKGIASLAWNRPLVQTSVAARYIGEYEDYAPSTRQLGDFWLVDANVSYDVGQALAPQSRYLDGLSLSGGVVNLFDKLPEYSFMFGTVGFDPRQYDIRGRFLYVQLGAQF